MNYHLAILAPGWIELILNGSKTIESRFAKVKCAPYGKINTGDVVYLKESGGPVKGQFTAAEVETFKLWRMHDLSSIFAKYRSQIFARDYPEESASYYPPVHWRLSRYATLIHVTDVIAYEHPFPYRQKGRSAWLLLKEPLKAKSIYWNRKTMEV